MSTTITPLLPLMRMADWETRWPVFLHVAESNRNLTLLIAIVSGNPQSDAIYRLEHKNGTWYLVDFDDQEYGGYNVRQFALLLENCGFLSLIERPGLLRSGLLWRLEPGEKAGAAFDANRIRG